MSQQPGRVVELFAGVGGFRIGLERELPGGVDAFDPEQGWLWEDRAGADWQVVFGNQWEPSTKSQPAFDCYAERFAGRGEHSNVDIAEVLNRAGVPRYDGHTVAPWDEVDTGPGSLPREFDLLVGGFPCQDYSVAKPLSQAAGMGGDKGALWWEIARILQQYRPPHVLLENVDRLLKSPSTQRGRDFAVMLACFAQLGYAVEWRVVNAADYGYPQRRRRVFIYATRDEAWFTRYGVDVSRYEADPPRWEALVQEVGRERLTSTGVLAEALECRMPEHPKEDVVSLGDTAADIDPHDISLAWKQHKVSPWRNAGVMVGGVAVTMDVESAYGGEELTLGDVLLPIDVVLREHPEVVIPAHQLDFSARPKRSTWNYLKGAKREERQKKGGFTYFYTEGAVAFPEPKDRASRTILTGEGGRSPSRFKLVVEQEVPDELIDDGSVSSEVWDDLDPEDSGQSVVYRRLTPVELERLDMFPDGWTAGMPDGKRAFCMGNALVIGIVDRIGTVIAERRVAGTIEAERSA
ncbi:MAG: DNA cytosine methyltransferase [Actinomycetes bacterium]